MLPTLDMQDFESHEEKPGCISVEAHDTIVRRLQFSLVALAFWDLEAANHVVQWPPTSDRDILVVTLKHPVPACH
jgi:hypothetical protein